MLSPTLAYAEAEGPIACKGSWSSLENLQSLLRHSATAPQLREGAQEPPPGRVYYFAYGSNMNRERLRARRVTVYRQQPAVMLGWQLIFQHFSRDTDAGDTFANVMVADPQRDAVFGILYEISNDMSVPVAHATGLSRLDAFEGVHRGAYRRTEVQVVQLLHSQTVLAHVYVADDTASFCEANQPIVPKQSYMRHLLAGAEMLPSAYVDLLKSLPTALPDDDSHNDSEYNSESHRREVEAAWSLQAPGDSDK